MEEMKQALEHQIGVLKKKLDEYSKIIGDKIRESDEKDHDQDIMELKEKLNGSIDPKKKKTVKKNKTDWHDFGEISVYDGIGLKGELELYFRAMEEIRSKIENLEKTKESIAALISRGLKRDLWCIALERHNMPYDVVFIKSDISKEQKFSFKSIFSINTESFDYSKFELSNPIII